MPLPDEFLFLPPVPPSPLLGGTGLSSFWAFDSEVNSYSEVVGSGTAWQRAVQAGLPIAAPVWAVPEKYETREAFYGNFQ
jgi:hypothetical protein